MGNIINCLKTEHMLLKEDNARTNTLHEAATDLAEIAQAYTPVSFAARPLDERIE